MNVHRITQLTPSTPLRKGDYVLYWMQQSQRVDFNHALEFAIQKANQKRLPLVVLFCLIETYPDANQRHFHFMLEGLKETKSSLEQLGATFVFRLGDPLHVLNDYAKNIDTLVLDTGYLRHQRAWHLAVQSQFNDVLEIYSIESDAIVPVQSAYPKAAYGAYVIRPTLHRMLPFYRDFVRLSLLEQKTKIGLPSDHPLDDVDALLKALAIDHSVLPTPYFLPGHTQGIKRLNHFLKQDLWRYDQSNDPSLNATSTLSMYLHFGQLSSLEVVEHTLAYATQNAVPNTVLDAFIEQLFVRRELAINYVYYQPLYDQFDHMTEPWAYQTMAHHQHDPRPYRYTKNDYVHFQTHDPYFNAAMKQMVKTGYMHNYMRMYWAKKIIEWTPDYREAYHTILSLNNTYFIDGRDPNGYAGVAWCFGKHDRPWTQRSIFGSLRYMNQEGLKRKFDIDLYVEQMNQLM